MRTEIATLGEFGLIDHLTEGIQLQNDSTKKGIGDDAAVLSYPADRQVLVTTDLLLEGVHFDLVYTPLKHLGYKAAVVNFSDIYAMNGTPRQITVSLGVSKRFSVEDMEQLYAGIRLACEDYGVDIVGGDTTSSLTGLTISITCIGEAGKDQIVYRNGAHETDLICVSGNLGAAYMGLQLLEREKKVFEANPTVQPDFTGKDYLLRRQLKPEPRLDIVEALRREDILPTAMANVSDGIAASVMQICHASQCGCDIFEEKLPMTELTFVTLKDLDIVHTVAALNGGDDYELMFTIKQSDFEKIKKVDNVSIIGYIKEESAGCHIVTGDNHHVELRAQGFANA